MSKRILIAEDQMITREALSKFAKARGYHVETVTNGVDLLDMVVNQEFDVVITDLIMPDLNGASATEIMRLQENNVPVIALTGLSAKDVGTVRQKFSRVFHKPVDTKELFDYVERVLEAR